MRSVSRYEHKARELLESPERYPGLPERRGCRRLFRMWESPSFHAYRSWALRCNMDDEDDNAVSVGNVGRDSSGAYLDVRCGDMPIEVGQSLWVDHGGRRLSVTIDQIDFYGQDVRVLHPGSTARIRVSPSEIALLVVDGMCLQPGGRLPE